jgi:hypothetical protein
MAFCFCGPMIAETVLSMRYERPKPLFSILYPEQAVDVSADRNTDRHCGLCDPPRPYAIDLIGV